MRTNNFMKNIIKKIIPIAFLNKRSEFIYKQQLNKLKWRVIEYLENNSIDVYDDEKQYVINFLKHNHFSVFPYDFINKYHEKDVIVYTDNVCGLNYVLQENKRLYFKRGWNKDTIKKYYNGLLIEQDIDSPHRYLYENFQVNEGDVVVDIGVAEGNFALSVVEKCKKLYLFESDNDWIEALNMTFSPFNGEGKVIIINKNVSDNNNNDNITLDNYFINTGNTEKINFIKVDIEGYELKFLKGAKALLENHQKIRMAICTYHRQDAGKKIKEIMTDYGYHSEYSKGLMIYFTDVSAQPCWLARGLLRCIKM
jgi:hypothetical protein